MSFSTEQNEDKSANSRLKNILSHGGGDDSSDDVEQGQEVECLRATGGKNVRKTTILVIIVFAAGLLSLLFMIKKSSPQSAGAAVMSEDTQIEIAIAKLTGVKSEMFEGMERIVKKFYEFSDVQQIGVGELVKNPFNIDKQWGVIEADIETQKSDTGFGAMELRSLRQRANKLRLLSILATKDSSYCCIIGDKILYEGDMIDGFRVKQISDGFVKLEWSQGYDAGGFEMSESEEFVLKLSK
ncbi:hypothetical protein ACFL3G_09615 [Planctomycetota bacterium]